MRGNINRKKEAEKKNTSAYPRGGMCGEKYRGNSPGGNCLGGDAREDEKPCNLRNSIIMTMNTCVSLSI